MSLTKYQKSQQYSIKCSLVIPHKCLTVHPWISSAGYSPDGFTIFWPRITQTVYLVSCRAATLAAAASTITDFRSDEL